ncbi:MULTISPECIES: TetR/AcrR family transcriptional regulator [Cyanophyceae]|uniref:TetR/AcrR family transcriptional regulator n=1 Tax=Cyanophyceae TaxID=3028117 RepID=UPI001686E9F5|nr:MULTISPECIES: TetR/AcrR family transcriptional regulator [Cyanophyceae]MBD1918965.1 TetR/AcrR family transcriptional regulator [Phormidium sp. FACHB-77]MBD2033193.1 TetR/AcrR family transcriptional regulator [Phormidium sp. FACHB-322]MBD2053874.1 TetR/AcrR family transcriptional regulator [Leptolyngbya sp. FACHB-60]
MADQRKSARQRLVDAAFQLFSSQGVGTTTTRQVADLAGVNEVTLFRQFGSKHGLLAAVMTEAEVLSVPDRSFDLAALAQAPIDQSLREFLSQCLATLDQLSELVRSVIGEAGQFSADNSQAMGRGLQTIRDFIAEYLEVHLAPGEAVGLPPEEVAGLVMALLLGYAAIDGTTAGANDGVESHSLWASRSAFIESVVSWLLSLRPHDGSGLAPAQPSLTPPNTESWIDIPAPVVHEIMQVARKAGNQTHALIYVLLGAGVAAAEAPLLSRASALYDSSQHILLIGPQHRQVPLNQWIMGRRYGTYTKNPLTRWLKSRSDASSAMFLGPDDQPITPLRVRQLWAEVTTGIMSPTGEPLGVEQARATWCVEMLLRGLNRQQLSLLSGLSAEQLDPLVQKAQARSALAQALRLDQQPGSAPANLDKPSDTSAGAKD